MSKRIIEVEERLPILPTIPLSLQHLFAMFGSTVLVPFLLNVDPATCLFMNGIGTLCTWPSANGNFRRTWGLRLPLFRRCWR